MNMTEERKARLKAYCRIDELTVEEEPLLESMYAGAVEYLEQAGVSEPAGETGRHFQYEQIINALVLDAWDNRGSQTAGYTMTDNPAFRRQLNQLKLTEPVSISDTGAGV